MADFERNNRGDAPSDDGYRPILPGNLTAAQCAELWVARWRRSASRRQQCR